MGKVAVATDSAACIPQDLVERHHISIVPFGLIWGNDRFHDGVDMTPEQFYRRFAQNHVRPTSSQPSPGEFGELYVRLAKEGYEGIVSIHVPDKLSGTVRSARLAAEQISPIPVRVIDALTAANPEGFIVLAAARAAESGASLDEVEAVAKEYIGRVGLFATLETLEHLRRGGRIGEAAALLGSRIGIFPVLFIKEGTVKVGGIYRSKPRAIQQILHMMRKAMADGCQMGAVFHGDRPEEAAALAEQVRKRFHCTEFYVTELTPVAGAHTGPGVIGVAYCV